MQPLINRTKFALPPSQYFATSHGKDLIVLHFTAGRSAASAFTTWKGDEGHVATAYLVDMDGSIYEVFDPRYWAYHLGMKGVSSHHERRSIGIEIANVGPLKQSVKDRTILNWWPGEFGTKYCGLLDLDKYVKSTYRGIQYFATFPAIQMQAIRELTHYLCERFTIPKVIPAPEQRGECDVRFRSFNGVACHANFRPDKWDVGPAFDWDALGIQQEQTWQT